MSSADKAIYTIELNDRLSPGMKKAIGSAIGLDKAMGKTQGTVKQSGKGLGMLAGAFSSLAPQIALATAGLKAFQVASESVQVAREFETLENSINFASGSAQEGAKNMKFLRTQAKLLGLPLKESAEGFKTLSASMMGSSLQGDPTREIFESVSIAASAMGLKAEDAKGTFLALGQIMGKGKVQAEELRGQIGERIPGAFNIAAKAMGVTQAELNKMMDDGKLVATDFLPKFAKELRKTFEGALPKAMESSQAQLNRFNNMWLELKLKLGRLLLPMVNKVMGAITKLVNFLSKHKDFIVSNIVEPLAEIFNIYKNTAKEAFSILTEGFNNSASAGDTFRAVIKGIGWWIKNIIVPQFKIWSKVAITVWKVIVNSWKIQFKIITSIWKGVIGGIMAGVEFVKLRFLGLKDIIAGAFTLDKEQIKKGINTYASAGEQAAKKFNDVWSRDTSISGVFNKISEGIGLAGGAANPNKKSTSLEVYNWQKSVKKFGATPTTAGAAAGGKESSTSVDGIKSGRPTHINIDIGKLIENMNITATDVDDMAGQIKDQVAKALFSAVSNVNNIAGV